MKKIILSILHGLAYSPIRSRVQAIINARIERAEADYAEGVEQIEREAEEKKEALENKLVEDMTSFIK